MRECLPASSPPSPSAQLRHALGQTNPIPAFHPAPSSPLILHLTAPTETAPIFRLVLYLLTNGRLGTGDTWHVRHLQALAAFLRRWDCKAALANFLLDFEARVRNREHGLLGLPGFLVGAYADSVEACCATLRIPSVQWSGNGGRAGDGAGDWGRETLRSINSSQAAGVQVYKGGEERKASATYSSTPPTATADRSREKASLEALWHRIQVREERERTDEEREWQLRPPHQRSLLLANNLAHNQSQPGGQAQPQAQLQGHKRGGDAQFGARGRSTFDPAFWPLDVYTSGHPPAYLWALSRAWGAAGESARLPAEFAVFLEAAKAAGV